MTDFYRKYAGLHRDVIAACNIINSNPCSIFSDEIARVIDNVNNVQINNWQDSAKTSFAGLQSQITSGLQTIQSSIDSIFVSAQETYQKLNEELKKLRTQQGYLDKIEASLSTITAPDVGNQVEYNKYLSHLDYLQQKQKQLINNCKIMDKNIQSCQNVLANIDSTGLSVTDSSVFLPGGEIPDFYEVYYSSPTPTIVLPGAQANGGNMNGVTSYAANFVDKYLDTCELGVNPPVAAGALTVGIARHNNPSLDLTKLCFGAYNGLDSNTAKTVINDALLKGKAVLLSDNTVIFSNPDGAYAGVTITKDDLEGIIAGDGHCFDGILIDVDADLNNIDTSSFAIPIPVNDLSSYGGVKATPLDNTKLGVDATTWFDMCAGQLTTIEQ